MEYDPEWEEKVANEFGDKWLDEELRQLETIEHRLLLETSMKRLINLLQTVISNCEQHELDSDSLEITERLREIRKELQSRCRVYAGHNDTILNHMRLERGNYE